MGARHGARRLALQALFALDANPETTPEDALERAGEETPGGDRGYADRLVREAWSRREELDRILESVSRRWKVHRMDRVDRCILRLAGYELLWEPEVPAPVVLNEGVELAKEFGTPDSSSFVNGVLDRIARDHRQSEVGGSGA